MEKLKSPSLILLIISLLYVGFMGVTVSGMMIVLGLCALNSLEYVLDGLKLYLNSKIKPERVLSPLELVQEDIKMEDATIRLERLRKRETNPLGFNRNNKELEF